MKILTPFLLLIIAAFAATTSVSAQSAPPPPPPMAPDYFPQSWKEFVYENDNLKLHLPKEPKITTSTADESGMTVTTRKYEHTSFIIFQLHVIEYPPSLDFEKIMPIGDLLQKMRDGGLAEVKRFNPKIIKESEITVDGYAGKFIQVETNTGNIVRMKFFVVKNRAYLMFAEVKKGVKHGVNHENDFEKVAMGFLDSVRLINPRK